MEPRFTGIAVSRNLSNIEDGASYENTQGFLAVNYFCKTFHHSSDIDVLVSPVTRTNFYTKAGLIGFYNSRFFVILDDTSTRKSS